MDRRTFFRDGLAYIAAMSAFVGNVEGGSFMIEPKDRTTSSSPFPYSCEEELRAIGYPDYCHCEDGQVVCHTTTTTCDPNAVGSWCNEMDRYLALEGVRFDSRSISPDC